MAAKEMAASKADPAQELQPTLTIDEMPPALARPDIGWYDMDLTRFVMWNCSIFFCIRCIVYPSMLIKTRLQAQHRVRHSFVFVLTASSPPVFLSPCPHHPVCDASLIVCAARPLHWSVERLHRRPEARRPSRPVPRVRPLPDGLHLLPVSVYASTPHRCIFRP